MVRRIRQFFLPLAIAVALAGCAEADRTVLFALAGERPGDHPLYPGTSASIRLGAEAPRMTDKLYRIPPLPAGEPGPALARLAHSAGLARQALADREHEYDLRRRDLLINSLDYAAIVQPLVPAVGSPLAPNNPATQSRLGAVKQAVARIGADIVALNGILLRQQHAKGVAERVAVAARQRSAQPGLTDAQRTLAQRTGVSLADSIAAAESMIKDGEKLVADYADWLVVQRGALETVEIEIAQGSATPPPGPARLFSRQTLFGRE